MRVLVMGMSSILGGVETYIYNLVKNQKNKNIIYDFLIVDNKTSVFQKEINECINDGENHFFFCPSIKKNFLTTRKWLKNFYKSHSYDLIYLNTCTAARVIYCEYAVKKLRIPLIVHSHSANATLSLHKWSNLIFRKEITKISKIRLACSEVAYKWMFTDVPKEGAVIPNGVELDRFKFNQGWRNEIRNQLRIGEADVLIGNVGRLSAQKNQSFLIDLCDFLDEKYKFIIIGDGELRENLTEEIKKNNLEKRVLLISAQKEIEKYYSAMDVFVMPSIFEGLPIVAIEAQAEGLPCILSENISKQTSLSADVVFRSLEDVDSWEAEIKRLSHKRYDGTKLVAQNGFDSGRPVEIVERILTECYEEHER